MHIRCPHCSRDFNWLRSACPRCWRANRRNPGTLAARLLGLIAVLVLIVLALQCAVTLSTPGPLPGNEPSGAPFHPGLSQPQPADPVFGLRP